MRRRWKARVEAALRRGGGAPSAAAVKLPRCRRGARRSSAATLGTSRSAEVSTSKYCRPRKPADAGQRRGRDGLDEVVVALHVRVEDPPRADDVVLDLGELGLEPAEAARGPQVGVGLRREVAPPPARRRAATRPARGRRARSTPAAAERASVSADIVARSWRAYASTACTRFGTRSRRRFELHVHAAPGLVDPVARPHEGVERQHAPENDERGHAGHYEQRGHSFATRPRLLD